MKFFALIIILFIASPSCATDRLISSSDCAKTLLTQSDDCIKEKRPADGIALYRQVRDHPNAKIWMIVRASTELMSHQYTPDSIIEDLSG